MVDCTHQEISRRNEIRVEDGDEFPLGGFHAFGQGTGLKPFPIGPMKIRNRITLRGIVRYQSTRNRDRLIRRIVEDLNVEFVQRIVKLANGFQQSFDDELLVKDRELDGYPRQFSEPIRRFGSAVFLVLIIKIDQQITMSAIRSQQNQDYEIRNQKGKIESIDLIKPFERGIEKVLPNVVPNALGGRESSESDRRIWDDVQLRRSFSLKAIQTGKLLYVRVLPNRERHEGSCDG